MESLRRYDPATQRSVETIDHVTIVPLRDALTEGPHAGTVPDATIFDYLAMAASERVVVSERDEIDTHGLALALEDSQHSYEEAMSRQANVLPLNVLLAEWPEVDARLARATNLAQLGIDEPLEPLEPVEPLTPPRALPAHPTVTQFPPAGGKTLQQLASRVSSSAQLGAATGIVYAWCPAGSRSH